MERIAPGVAVLFGRGGNIGVSWGADGNILIDDQYAPATERVLVETGLRLANDETRIIPGHGRMARRADLVAYLVMLRDVRTRVAAAIRQRRTLAQIQALHIADRYNRRPNNFISRESFVETIWRSLRTPSADHHR